MSSQFERDVERTVRSRRPRTHQRRRAPTPRRPSSARRALKRLLFVLLPVVFLAAIAAALVYVRLANGPISLAFLKPTIERHIQKNLGAHRVSLSDVVLGLDSQGLELKLEDVRVIDNDRAPVASAPYAALQVDKTALLRGEFSLSGITLIRPRIHVSYSDQAGLSLSFADTTPPGATPDEPRVRQSRPDTARNDGTGAGAGAGWQAHVNPAGETPPPPRTPQAHDQPQSSSQPASTPPSQPSGDRLPQTTLSLADRGSPPTNRTAFEMLAEFMREVARSTEPTGGLDRMGVRNAIIVFEHAGRRSIWGVPAGDIEVKRSGRAVLVTGLASIADGDGNSATLAFTAETSEESRQIALTGSIRDIRPKALTRLVTGIDNAAALDAPVSAEGQINLTAAGGDVVDGRITFEVGSGAIAFPTASQMAPVRLDHGRLAIAFSGARPAVDIAPSSFAWGDGNELHFKGRAAPDGDGGSMWSYTLDGLGGRLVKASGAARSARTVEAWTARGTFAPHHGVFAINQADLSVAGLRTLFDAVYDASTPAGAAATDPRVRVAAQISPGPLESLPYLWPENLALDARAWMMRNIAGGRLTEGRISYRWPPVPPEARDQGAPREALSIALSGEAVALAGVTRSGLIVAPKALLRLTDQAFEVAMPEAELTIKGAKPLALRQVRFEIDDVWRNDLAGTVAARLEGPLDAAARLILADGAASPVMNQRLEALADKAAGQVSAKLEMVVPLDGRAAPAPRPTGEVRITGARVKDVVSGHDLTGGRFDITLAEKVITTRGEVLIDGVATKLDWHHIYDASRARQPPIRLRANLDEADRDKLGINVNHILRGILQAELLLAEREDGTWRTEARIDAGKAQISVESLAWVKPAGQDTLIDFEVAPDAKGGVSLEKLRIAGDGIAIQGRAMLDRNFALRAFEFPSFSIDRVTRLAIAGRLARDNNWRVDVKGQTYEGSSLFRSLFNAGQVKGGLHTEDPNQPGVDLQADIKTVLGFWSSRLSNVRLTLSKRAGRLKAMQLDGDLAAGGRLKAALVRSPAGRRELHAFSSNAGEAFRLVGFYPNARRGSLELVVDLDGRGAAEKSGVLLVRDFDILGDEVVREMAAAPSSGVSRRAAGAAAQTGAQSLSFDWMRLPFLVGNGQFILRSAELRGPVVGATLQGKADFDARLIDVSGTYVPLQGLNGALGVIPGLGQILAGPKGEGVLGMKFAVRGQMGRPEVLVNPLSLMAPGIFREIFQITNPSLEVTERSTGQGTPARPPAESRRGWARRAFGESN